MTPALLSPNRRVRQDPVPECRAHPASSCRRPPAPVRLRATVRPSPDRGRVLDRPVACPAPVVPAPVDPAPRARATTPSPPPRAWVGRVRRAPAPRRRRPAARGHRPAGPRRPAAVPACPGMPRPNPAMMPRQASGQLGGARRSRRARPSRWSARSRHPGPSRWRRPPVVAVPVAVPAVRRPVVVAVAVVAAEPRVPSVAPVVRPVEGASPRSSAVKSSTRWRRRRSVAYGSSPADGQKVRLARGASLTDLAEKIGVDVCLAGPGAVPPRRDGDRDPVGLRRHPAGAGRGAQLRHRGRLARGRGPRAAGELRHRVRRERRWRGGSGGPAAGGHRDGSRRPRQDQAAGRDPQDQRGGARGRWHHPGDRRLPGRHRGRRQRAGDHLHRHPGPRGVHRHARPGRQVDRHRRAGGGGRRRCDAADHRGAQPRLWRPRCRSWSR